jgi:hypothetical protein
MSISACGDLKSSDKSGQDLEQQQLEPLDEAAEVVADGGENGVGVNVAPEVVAAHPVFGFEVTGDRLDGGAPAQFAFDLRRQRASGLLCESQRRTVPSSEAAVSIVQRWILARLRNRRFFSLAELNVAIRTPVDELNARLMRKLGASRREFFDTIDRPALMPLPAEIQHGNIRGRGYYH